MQVRLVIFPGEEGLDVVVWGKWAQGTMIALLKELRLLTPEEAHKLEDFAFLDYCPLYSGDIEEDVLTAHGFQSA